MNFVHGFSFLQLIGEFKRDADMVTEFTAAESYLFNNRFQLFF